MNNFGTIVFILVISSLLGVGVFTLVQLVPWTDRPVVDAGPSCADICKSICAARDETRVLKEENAKAEAEKYALEAQVAGLRSLISGLEYRRDAGAE